MDQSRDGGQGSPEHELASAVWYKNSPRAEEQVEEMMGHHSEDFMGRCDSEVRPAMVKGEQRRLSLVDKWLRTERNDVECGKLLQARMGWCATPFIGLGRDEVPEERWPARWILTQPFLKPKMGKRRWGGADL
jgi:hypothetical protein